jgi:hypothetical protein
MKKYCIISFLALSLGVFSCKDKEVSGDEIYGRWELESYCKQNSVSSCEEVKVPKNKSVVIEFKVNGNFDEVYENTIPVEYGFLGCGKGNFSHDDEAVYVQLMCMSSTFPRKIPIIKHTRKELILKPFDNGEYRFKRL